MANKKVGLSYGALSDKLAVQLKKQGLKFDKEKIGHFQKELDAVNILRFGSGLITDGMMDKMLPKLHKAIMSHVAKQNGVAVVK